MRRIFPIALVVFASCSGDSAGGGTKNPTEPAPIASIEIAASRTTIAVTDTVMLTAITKDGSGRVLTGRTVHWSSSNGAIASVDGGGVVRGVAPGNVTIQAAAEGRTATVALTVTPPPVASVTIAPDTATMVVGTNRQFTATLRDPTGAVLTGRAVQWSSSAAAIATVDTSGRVSAIAPGTASITAASGGKEGRATVTVIPVPVAGVTVSPDSVTLSPGGTHRFTAVARDAAGNELTGRSVTWSVASSAVATVDAAGLVTAVAAGRTVVRASVSGVSDSAVVNVNPTLPSTGLLVRVNTPIPASSFAVAIDGGSFGSAERVTTFTSTSTTSGAIGLSVPAGGPYRVRVLSVDRRGSSFPAMVGATGKVDGVTVNAGSVTTVNVTLTAPTVQISAPASVSGGAKFTVTWTVTDPGAALDTPCPVRAPSGFIHSATAPFADGGGKAEVALGNRTKLSDTRYQISAELTAPMTPGTLYYQVTACTFANIFRDVPSADVIFPSTRRGESLRTITIQ